jgi:hypothetical protein
MRAGNGSGGIVIIKQSNAGLGAAFYLP